MQYAARTEIIKMWNHVEPEVTTDVLTGRKWK